MADAAKARERKQGAVMRRQVKGEKAVRRELVPGQSKALLQELHLLTRDGDLNADSLRKLKQVNHLVGFLQPAVEDVLARHEQPVLVDCGAGKSYLGFILYELFLAPAGRGRLICVESRESLVQAGRERAARLGYERLEFVHAPLEEAVLPERVHVLMALHACDTATDDALAHAIAAKADHVAVVPCCQAEVAAQLAKAKQAGGILSSLHAHPWHRRELGSHLTNVIRALALEAKGYQVTVTELAGWEHSLKNELILGKRVKAYDSAAANRLEELLAAFQLQPKLMRSLREGSGATTGA
jgi:hypothetical protein